MRLLILTLLSLFAPYHALPIPQIGSHLFCVVVSGIFGAGCSIVFVVEGCKEYCPINEATDNARITPINEAANVATEEATDAATVVLDFSDSISVNEPGTPKIN